MVLWCVTPCDLVNIIPVSKPHYKTVTSEKDTSFVCAALITAHLTHSQFRSQYG